LLAPLRDIEILDFFINLLAATPPSPYNPNNRYAHFENELDSSFNLHGESIGTPLFPCSILFTNRYPLLDKGKCASIDPIHLVERIGESTMQQPSSVLIWKETTILLNGPSSPLPAVAFADPQAVQAFLRRLQQGRRHISALAISYLRGKTYLAEKQPHGGNHCREEEASLQNDTLKTARWLAREFQVGEATIHRDAQLATEIDHIAGHCGDQVRELLLARNSGLTRKAIFKLAGLPPADQQRLFGEWVETGQWPARAPNPEAATITLPREPKAFAEKVGQSFDKPELAAILEALLDLGDQGSSSGGETS
jgi:hypothetical protein